MVDKHTYIPILKTPTQDDGGMVVKSELSELRKDLTDTRSKIFESLGVFVALFTFVSVEFQIFTKDLQSTFLVGLTLILLSGLSIFGIIDKMYGSKL